ncbi:CPXCG motif-containing cysteine-rich protein [Kangiella spongicola]|uniref:CPXCG motif-containing cysteine-rich protein n=1 Tax=Kangiella spongicola TaxID=796379 RepID=A0A318D9M2_9GAMM|nr:CPXCG motif-containing cysteine-rich protein [Kangiella spongicola]PXF63587.1 CPXCG motif-containing cysteine-rich protein [Kangiella spongicola]
MNQLIEKDISCPYCGENITVLIDGSVPHQEYIEDCQVCCRPIEFVVFIMDREVKVEISTDR